ncbi:MAG: PAS domain S-box protein [Nitrospira sp.]|nr:PAS domain S-box protein [Nitrospira sp.]
MSQSVQPDVGLPQRSPSESGAVGPGRSERERAIAAAQVRHLYDHAPYGLFATFVTALLLVAVEWGVADHPGLLWWAAYMGALTAVRFVWLLQFRRVSASHTNLDGWGTLFLVGATLAGLGWGLSGLLFFPEASTPHQMFLMLILCAMTAGAIPILSGRMTVYMGFLIPSMSPAILRFFVQGDGDAMLMGWMGLVFMGAMAFGAWKMQGTILETLAFRYDNLDLATKLTWEVVERKQAARALRLSHERFELAAEGSREGLWDVEVPDVPPEQWFRPDRPIYYSPRFKALLGFTEEEFPNVLSSWESRLHPDDRARVLDAAFAHLLGKGSYEVEYRLLAKSGEYRWYVSRGQAIWDDTGRPVRMAGSFSDVTERKRAEAALRESQEQYRILVDQAQDIIYRADPNGRFTFVNPAAVRLMGYSERELLSFRFTDLVCPGYREKTERFYGRQFVRKTPTTYFEFPALTKEGKTVWVGQNVQLHEKDGTVTGFQAVVRDITERKQAEEALRASESQYRLLVDQANDIIYRTDAQGYLTFVNVVTARITGYPESELLGRRFVEFIRADARAAAERFYGRQFVRKRNSTYYEYPLVRKDGTEVWIGQNVQVLLDGDRVVGFQAVARDITDLKKVADALRQSEERWKIIFESAPDAYYLSTLTGEFVDGNRKAEELIGYRKKELIGKNFLKVDLLPTSALPKAIKLLALNVIGRATGPDEFLLKTKSGAMVPVEISTAPTIINGRKLLMGIARDITERKRSEEALKEQMRLSMLAAEVNGALVQSSSLQTMLQSCAEALVRHLDAAFARVWLLGPGDLCSDCHKMAQCADRTQCLHLEASAGLYRNLNGEYRRIPLGVLKIGKIAQGKGAMATNDVLGDDRLPNKLWMKENGLQSFAGYPLLLGQQVVGVMAIFARHPLTDPMLIGLETVSKALTLGIERKKAEEALQESEQRLELALHGGDLGTWDWQVPSGAVIFNQRWAGMLGYTSEEIEPHFRSWERLVHPDDLPHVLEALQAHLEGRTPSYETEKRLKTKDGGWKWILVRGRVVERDAQGSPLRVTGTHLDITDRKRAEAEVKERSRQLESANKELEAFSYSVSHDLRAPLRHIGGFAELLEEHAAPVLDQKGHEYLRAISTSAQRMGRLIDDLLAFSRMGRAELNKRVVPLEALVRSVIEDLQPETKGRTIDWTIGALPKVYGDPALLRQVWFNLVANAIKYTQTRARATIEVGRAPAADDRETVIFVRDNGVGFDMQYVDKLFGVFQRLHSTDEFEGSGIGLANVQRIVARHGGRVWAEGGVGRGATFYVALPVLEGDRR